MSRILEFEEVQALINQTSQELVVEAATVILDGLRRAISEGTISEEALKGTLPEIPARIAALVDEWLTPSLRPIVNATGVILFTNAGRSPLSRSVLEQAAEVGQHYSNLEYNLEAGGRGHRDLHFEARAKRLLGCEAATVCNNAAAAILLTLNTLALGKKVLVSRGELIEIGGSFRLPAVMEKSGAVLREVGTTNKTKAADYRDAIDDETALILRVHPSNYQIIGFTERPEISELVAISRESGIPLFHDAGSGYLFRGDQPFLSQEPVVSESLQLGSDLVCFSGDKLLGGPQAGLILGRKALVDRIRKNPLMRALRVDKLTYACLEATLREYQTGSYRDSLPIWKMMSLPATDVKRRAEGVLEGIASLPLEAELIEGFSVPGGGSAPEEQIPTWLISIASKGLTPNQLEQQLRRSPTPILTRIENDRVLLDLRTVFPEQDAVIVERLGVIYRSIAE
ncbi:MAG: L-seryl-tRNA(Sec) selenium transferase [Acidobacteriota bacterium]|nr:MAG: L-seryl-tRNA(Sec) selenium transferase [Acidobacteriota bacterium]